MQTFYFTPVVSSSFFFPRLFSVVADWMSTKLSHIMWTQYKFKMHVWKVLHTARWKYRTQKIAKNVPSVHHRTTLSAIGHSQSPDPISGTCFQTNSETLTVLSLHSDSHWRHSSSTSISVLQHIRGAYNYVPYKSTFYLLTTSSQLRHVSTIRKKTCWTAIPLPHVLTIWWTSAQ